MLFKKSTPSPTSPKRSLAWQQVDRKTQSLHFVVDDWQYKVFPSRQSRSFGTWMFQYAGICCTAPFDGLVVTGSVDVLERNESPSMLADKWRKVPENVEGYAFLMESDDKITPPVFGLTLYCQEAGLDWIYRAFSTAANSRSGSVSIKLTFDCPNNQGGPFWQEQWREEWLRVASWEVFAGAQLRQRN